MSEIIISSLLMRKETGSKKLKNLLNDTHSCYAESIWSDSRATSPLLTIIHSAPM